MKKGKFDFEDYLESMKQMQATWAGCPVILSMMPGMGSKMGDIGIDAWMKNSWQEWKRSC